MIGFFGKRGSRHTNDNPSQLADLERELGGPVLVVWMTPNFCLSDDHVFAVQQVLAPLGRVSKLNLILKSNGGDGMAALRLTRVLRHAAESIHLLVPLECASAATMVALCADSISMGPMGFLSPIDTSLNHDLSPASADFDRVSVSEQSLKRAEHLLLGEAKDRTDNPYTELFKHVHPLVVGEIERASGLTPRLCHEILAPRNADAETETKLVETLDSGYPSHSYPIGVAEAQSLGLPAQPMSDAIHEKTADLCSAYAALTDRSEVRTRRRRRCTRVLSVVETQDRGVQFRAAWSETYSRLRHQWSEEWDTSGWYDVKTGAPNPMP